MGLEDIILMLCMVVLLDSSVWKAIKDCTSNTVMKDVRDGRKYKEDFSSFVFQGNVTLMANTDGLQLFKSSTVAMWPIWVTINELPVRMR